MNKGIKNPFTFKQWGHITYIKDNITEDKFKIELWKMYQGRYLMTLSQNELDRFIFKMFFKYNLSD